jgi:PPOX class probable F420-dependent enzyme
MRAGELTVRLSWTEALRRLADARVLRLATLGADAGFPHLVPATFALHEGRVVIAVDHKPKRHQNLARLRNIEADDRVCALADAYTDDDWTRLWWVRADGRARILTGGAREAPLDALAAKYPQYVADRPTGPVIQITVERLSGWQYAGGAGADGGGRDAGDGRGSRDGRAGKDNGDERDDVDDGDDGDSGTDANV